MAQTNGGEMPWRRGLIGMQGNDMVSSACVDNVAKSCIDMDASVADVSDNTALLDFEGTIIKTLNPVELDGS